MPKHSHDFVETYNDLVGFGLNRETDENTVVYCLQKFSDDRLMELLKQPQYNPWPLRHEVMLIFAGTRGLIDEVEVADVDRWSQEFVRYMDTAYLEISDQVAIGKWTDEIESALRQGIADFNENWSA